jgi:hypothetical protein
MIAVPADLPNTTPVELTEAIEVLAVVQLPAPPPNVSTNVMVDPVQTVLGPEIVPALGKRLTVTVLVAVSLPQVAVETM